MALVKLDVLRGNPFIAEKEGKTPRTCGCCLYRDSGDSDCDLSAKSAHKDFGVSTTAYLPNEIDGVKVGHYCKYWVHFANDQE